MPTQNIPLWYKNDSELMATEKWQTQQVFSALPFLPEHRTCISFMKVSPHFSQTREGRTMFNTRDRDGKEISLHKQTLQNKPYQ